MKCIFVRQNILEPVNYSSFLSDGTTSFPEQFKKKIGNLFFAFLLQQKDVLGTRLPMEVP